MIFRNTLREKSLNSKLYWIDGLDAWKESWAYELGLMVCYRYLERNSNILSILIPPRLHYIYKRDKHEM